MTLSPCPSSTEHQRVRIDDKLHKTYIKFYSFQKQDIHSESANIEMAWSKHIPYMNTDAYNMVYRIPYLNLQLQRFCQFKIKKNMCAVVL